MTEVAIIGHSIQPLNFGLCVEALKAEGIVVVLNGSEVPSKMNNTLSIDEETMNSWWRTRDGIYYLDSLMQSGRPTPQKQNQRKVRRDTRRRAKR